MDDTEDIDGVAFLDIRQDVRKVGNDKLSCAHNPAGATKVRLQDQQLRSLPNSSGHILGGRRIIAANILNGIIEVG